MLDLWRQTNLIRRGEVSKILARSSFRVTLLLWGAFFVAIPLYAYLRLQGVQEQLHLTEPLRLAFRQYFADIFFARYSFVMILMAGGSLLTELFLRERLEGSLESLLVAPVEIRQVWLGKCLGLFQVGYLYSLAVSILYLIALSVVQGGWIAPSGWAIATFLAGVPLLGFSVLCLAGLLELTTSSARLLHLILFAVSFVLLYTGFGGMRGGGSPLLGPLVFLTYLVLSAVIWAVIAALRGRLTKEQALLA